MLGVSNVADSIRFYRDGLSLPMQEREDDSDAAFFTLDGTWLSLYPGDLLAEDATVNPDGNGFSGITIAHNVSSKEEVDTVLDVQSENMRDIMIEIVAEEDSRDLDFDNPERYREELTSVKEDGKKRLETGESVLSISLGAVLLGINIAGLELLEATIWGYSATFPIQIWLLAITVSIVYRTTALEFLAFSSDDRFDSLEQMDAALGYQKGVSLVGFAQGLTFLVVFTAAISRVKYDIISAPLRAKYTDKPWVSLAWKQLKEQ